MSRDEDEYALAIVSPAALARCEGLALALLTQHLALTEARYLRSPFAPGAPYEIDPPKARRLLEAVLRRGADHSDLFAEFAIGGSLVLADGIVRTASRGFSSGVGFRACLGEGSSYAYTENPDWDALMRCAETVAQLSDGPARAVSTVAEVPRPDRYGVERPSVLDGGPGKRDILTRMSRAAHAVDPRVRRVEASLLESYREILVATSDGRFVRDVQPMIRVGVQVVVEDKGQRYSGSSGGGGRMGMEYLTAEGTSPEAHAREAARRALAQLDPWEAPAGAMDVVLGPGVSGAVLQEAIGRGLEADYINRGASYYAGRLNTQVASRLCTVVDRSDIEHARGSINVDDEGNTGAATTLIEGGTLRGYLHDAMSARRSRVSPTGNGRRESFRGVPMPRVTNLMLLPGPHDPKEIVRSVKRGVYAASVGEVEVNVGSGDFEFSLEEAYLIEDGRLTAPLGSVLIRGNGPDVFSRVTMLGSDFRMSDGVWTSDKDHQNVPMGVGGPTVRIPGMTVRGGISPERWWR